jgi:hypothetical protein
VWTAAHATSERRVKGIPLSRRSTEERWGGSYG